MYGGGGDPQANGAQNLLLASLLSEALANVASSSSTQSTASSSFVPATSLAAISSAPPPSTLPPLIETMSTLGALQEMNVFLQQSSARQQAPSATLPPVFSAPPAFPPPTTTTAALNAAAAAQLISSLSADILRLSNDARAFHLHDDATPPPPPASSAAFPSMSPLERSALRFPPPPPTTTLPALSLSSIVNGSSNGSANDPLSSANDKPLDLSIKKTSTCSMLEPSTSSPRGSVIKNSFPAKSAGVKRSTSSLSYRPATEFDVSDHFRRSLSGKWPRRPANYAQYTTMPPQTPPSAAESPGISSPLQTRRMFAGTPKSCVSQIVINEGEVEDHFRRTFELLQKNEEESAQQKAKEAADGDAQERTSTSTRL
ncbi:hypothetical protein M3Y99_00719900 [Aphelenchoides fujianensis]|nr:hypothetical protein M3Y99_00719900 [Aphelenchoides fujianensis]